MLNHPNILAIYDIGVQDGMRFIVSELLEGESLRARLRVGPLHPRKATDYMVQVARGLAAAHEKGIVHRDLKPENLFVTRDGQVKILDFGLVKLMHPRMPLGQTTGVDEHAPTLPVSTTEPGRILGTVGYMAPEQIRGASGDHRSDIFSFGVILYELLAGRQPFRGDSPIETLNAILKEEPAELTEIGVNVPPALDRVIRHCLEKSPDERFQSARDLAFGLGSMSGLTSQVISFRSLPRLRPRAFVKPLAWLTAFLIVAAAAYLVGTRRGTRPPASFKRLTFRSGTIVSAYFSPDGETVFYGARWSGSPISIYSVRADSPESRDLGFGTADILSVSSTGQLAISLDRHPAGYLRDSGTLAQVAIAGGAPRRLAEDVETAAWSPDGSALAVVRTIEGKCRLEYPIGTVLYDTAGWISHPRFSPNGDTIAFIDHPFTNDDRGTIALVTVAKKEHRTLSPDYQSVEGLAWTPNGGELWFGADETSAAHGRAIIAVTPRGRTRTVLSSPTWLWLHDIAPDGRALISEQTIRAGIVGLVAGDTKERDLSWLDYSVVRDLSADGKTILFSESGEAGGSIFGVYLRGIDGSPAVRLGEGTTEALSPDGRWVLSIGRDEKPAQIRMLPTGAGQARKITSDRIEHRNTRWFPDGKRILFLGNRPNEAPRLWVQSIDGGPPRPIATEGATGTLITPDGTRVLARTKARKWFFFPVDGDGAPQPVPLEPGDVPMRFAADGGLFVATFGKIPALLTRVDLATGERTVTREVMPAQPAGLINVGPVWPTPDGKTTVYSYTRLLSDLYLVETAEAKRTSE
jgi:Tol biopolymer transport system component